MGKGRNNVLFSTVYMLGVCESIHTARICYPVPDAEEVTMDLPPPRDMLL